MSAEREQYDGIVHGWMSATNALRGETALIHPDDVTDRPTEAWGVIRALVAAGFRVVIGRKKAAPQTGEGNGEVSVG